MLAVKCDRCKSYFDSDVIRLYLRNGPLSDDLKRPERWDEVSRTMFNIELCPPCGAALKEFLETSHVNS